MLRLSGESLPRSVRQVGLLLLALSVAICLSCASSGSRFNRSSGTQEWVLGVKQIHSTKPEDCLASCVNMLMTYYAINATVPDTSLPLRLISLSQRLNTERFTDAEGNVLFASVLELSPDEIVGHLKSDRPLILVYRPGSQQVYHSVVVSGYSSERARFLVNNPVLERSSWIKISKFPTFKNTGKYLILLVALHES